MNDKIKEVSGQYLTAAEIEEREQNKSLTDFRGNTLSTIPLPPEDVMRSGFLTAIKYKSIEKALNAYNDAVQGLVRIKDSQSDFNRAVMEELRTIETLNDAETIHRADKAVRDAETLRAEQHLKQVEHEAYLAEKQREVEKHNLHIQHAKLMGTTGTEDLTEEEQEAEAYMRAKLRPSRYQSVADKIRQDTTLTTEQKKILDGLVSELTTAVD